MFFFLFFLWFIITWHLIVPASAFLESLHSNYTQEYETMWGTVKGLNADMPLIGHAVVWLILLVLLGVKFTGTAIGFGVAIGSILTFVCACLMILFVYLMLRAAINEDWGHNITLRSIFSKKKEES